MCTAINAGREAHNGDDDDGCVATRISVAGAHHYLDRRVPAARHHHQAAHFSQVRTLEMASHRCYEMPLLRPVNAAVVSCAAVAIGTGTSSE